MKDPPAALVGFKEDRGGAAGRMNNPPTALVGLQGDWAVLFQYRQSTNCVDGI
jgi:hypothetical protein